MKKTIRQLVSESIRNSSMAGIAGGAITAALGVAAAVTGNTSLLTGVIAVGAVTATASVALFVMSSKKLDEGVTVPIEQISRGDEVTVSEAVPSEVSEAGMAVNFAKEGRLAAAQYIAKIADGDFTAEIPEKIKTNEMGASFMKLSENINRAFGNIYNGAEAVNTDGQQVSGVSMSLSVGAAEQAGTISELSDSIGEVKESVLKNTENAHNADRIAEEVSAELEESIAYMKSLVSAMDNIHKSTEEISGFIKVIEDIAFQTNILALNSSVEAARAGEAGKGFAVVAMEVKNLATRSQEAAQQTTAVIEECVRNVKEGLGKTTRAEKSISSLASETKEISRLIGVIKEACDCQSESIIKINSGVERINASVQNTNNAAQECVASVQKLTSRSGMLRSEIGNFRFKEDGSAPVKTAAATAVSRPAPVAEIKKSAPMTPMKKAEQPKAAEEVKKPEPVKAPAPAVTRRPAPIRATEIKKSEPVKATEINKPEPPKPIQRPAPARGNSDSYANAQFVETPDTKY